MVGGSALRSTFNKTAIMCTAFGSRQTVASHLCLAACSTQGFSHVIGEPRWDLHGTGLLPKKHTQLSISQKRYVMKSSAASERGSIGATESAEKPNVQSGNSTESESTQNGAAMEESFPAADLDYKRMSGWDMFVMRLKMLIALPWQRVRKGSVLKLKLSGKVTEQFQGRFTNILSLPQICQNLVKAAYDSRITGVLLHIEPLDCGWGKIEEIRRHILFFKQSGKFIISYMTIGGEKEYYLARTCQELYTPPSAYITLYGLKVQASFLGGVLEKVGVEPEVQRIGKYKSVGDLLSRKDMSEANREMLTALLDDIYVSWIEEIAALNGKSKEEVEGLLNEGIYELEKFKEKGWITDIKYDDEIEKLLKERLHIQEDKKLLVVDNRKYSRVTLWTLNLSGGKEKIAVLRAVGSISRSRAGINTSGDGIVCDQFIKLIRRVRDAKNFKAVVLRIDSPGGDALASDLMWRELRLLAAKKPLVASMADVAASGGYYMAMAAGAIVAEKLTLTGSIGVVTGRFSLAKLYERVGYTKEVISRGRFAELDAEQRPLRPEERDFFAKMAQNAYKQFRDKAAFSRAMEVDKMEEAAQGRVWTGKAAREKGLIDAIGGISQAVAIVKQKAGIPQDKKVSLIEMSRRSPSLLDVVRSSASAVVFLTKLASQEGRMEVLKELDVPPIHGLQARMENLVIDGSHGDLSELLLLVDILKGCGSRVL